MIEEEERKIENKGNKWNEGDKMKRIKKKIGIGWIKVKKWKEEEKKD